MVILGKQIAETNMSYIILIPDGNSESLFAEINGLFIGRNGLKRFWNFDSRFVVAGANKFSMSLQKNIFHILSLFRIYNCIIVSPEHAVTDTEYSRPETFNELDTGMKLALYSWFPYQSSDRCDNVHDITILNSWVIYGQGHFTNNTDLFPPKIGKSFNGCPMKATVVGDNWEVEKLNISNMNSDAKVAMREVPSDVILLMTVLQQMNMTLLVTTIGLNGDPMGFISSFKRFLALSTYQR
jgi:hypothetical protein